jgi:hypothetical protein
LFCQNYMNAKLVCQTVGVALIQIILGGSVTISDIPIRLFSFQKQTVACWPHPHPKEKTKKSSPLEAESVWFEFESPPPPPASTSSVASAIAYTSLLLRLRWLFKSALLPQTLAASATSGSRLSAIRGTCTATSTHSCSDLQLKVERGLLRTRQSWPYVVDSL